MTDKGGTYLVWTVRFTWRVADQDGNPLYTYDPADGETRAVDRAVSMLDSYQNTATRALVCANVKQPDGTWSEVPRANDRLTPPVRFASQHRPGRPP